MDPSTPPTDPGHDAAAPALPLRVAPPGGPWRALWQLLQPVLGVLLLLMLIGAAALATAVWLLRSPEGTAWLLARVPGLEVKGLRGALLSDAFGAERLVLRWDQGQQSLAIDELQGSGLQWAWHPAAGAWVGLQAAQLKARRVDLQTGPAGPRPIQLPGTLQMPLRLQVTQLQVVELQIDALPPMHAVKGRGVVLWEPGARGYHAEAVTLDWDRAHIEGRVSLAAQPPFNLQAQARIVARTEPGQTPAWTAEASAAGPLARFDLKASLRGEARRGATAPELDLQTSLTPLEAWPVGRLHLRTQALDLASLISQAPRTALSGQMDIDSQSFTGPLGATVEIDNALPGRWNEGRVPVRRLHARLRSPDKDRSHLQIEDFDLQFANGSDNVGRWRGSGQWTASRLQLNTRIEALRPQGLDARAAVMNLSGPLALTVSGLPSPDPMAAPAKGPFTPSVELQATLEGSIEGSPHPVKLIVDGTADRQRVEVRELRAEAGAAQAALTLSAQRAAGQPWQLRSSGRLSDFDPVAWWPGSEGTAWRNGPHRLSGNWTLDLTLPRVLPEMSPLALAQTVVGSGKLSVERSVLAGVPLALQLELGHRPGTGPAPSSLRGELVLGGNRLNVTGQGNPLGDGQADRLRLDLQGDNLAGLAPLARLLPDLAPWAPRSGKAQATLSVEGRWPDIRSDGKAAAQDLTLGTLQARQLQASWRFDTANGQPLMLQAELQGLNRGGQKLDNLRIDLRGTGRQHHLDVAAALPLNPPPGLELALGLRTAVGTLVQMRADGQWLADGNGGGRWTGQVAQLTLGPWGGPGVAAPTGAGSTWLDARDLRAQARFDAKDGLTDLQAAAGRLQLADAVTVRWDEVSVDLRGTNPHFALRADIEPFALAPLLARAQPDMGWSGDLRLAARIDLKVGDKVDADLVFERRDGDLRLTDEVSRVPFGLTEVRVAAQAHDGRWQLNGSFAGQALGQASANLDLRTRPEQRWPTADTPIQGRIDAAVANLGIWGTWVPPGWRLSGELQTSASIAGTLAAPTYTGEVRASEVTVRNLLLGVDVRQGEASIKLNGATAEIERFTLRGGDGEIKVSGRADLGAKPVARLRLDADKFRVLGRIDRQLTASGTINLTASADQLRVDGKVRVDEGLFDLSRSDAPSLDDDVSIRQAGAASSAESNAPAASARPRRNQVVAIELDLGDKLRVRGRGLDTTLGGELRIGSTSGRLTVNGIVSASDGTYAAYGQKLEIERGMVIFNGDVENPALDVLALRPDLDIQAGVAINGPLRSPRVRLYTSTDMSESDKLSWLVLGRASEGLGRSDTALLQRAAVALLAGDGEAPTDTLLRNLGLDQLSVRQSDTDVRETVVSLGKQLSRRWYVGYERGVNATAGTWQLIYRIAQRFTLRAQSGLENSLDLIWVWRLQGDPPQPTPKSAPVPKSAASAPP